MHKLILYNDDHNSFGWVIGNLIITFGYGLTQAEQCAYLAHHKGQCTVKEGQKENLQLLEEQLLEAGINVRVKSCK